MKSRANQSLLRYYLFWWSPLWIAAALGAIFQFSKSEPIIDSIAFAIAMIIVLEWLLTVPHEFGHAVAARFFNYPNIRIMIGFGKPIFTGRALGFPWIFHSQPFGGMVTFDSPPKYSRWQFAVIVAMGPAVSALFVILIWWFYRDSDAWWRLRSWPGVFFWANIWVLAISLLPSRSEMAGRQTGNDGLLILHTIFGDRNCFKWSGEKLWRGLGATILGAASLGLAWLTFLVLTRLVPVHGGIGFFCGALIGWLAYLLGSAAYKIWTEPFVTGAVSLPKRPVSADILAALSAQSPLAHDAGFAKISGQFSGANPTDILRLIEPFAAKYAIDPWLLYFKSYYEVIADQPLRALDTLAPLDSLRLDPDPRYLLTVAKLHALIAAKRFAEAEQLSESFLAAAPSPPYQAAILRALVTLCLDEEPITELEHLERHARHALELDPDRPELKATLGAVLIELGQLADAEPLLMPVIESDTLHEEKAHALFSLARIRASQGKTADAKQILADVLLYTQGPKLKVRVAKTLTALDKRGNN